MPDSAEPALVGPPTVDPKDWEDHAVFRETFLLYLTRAEYNAALRQAGVVLFDLVLEASRALLPEPPGGRLRADLLAAAGDLRHLQGFLGMLGDEQHDPETDPEGAALSRRAGRLALKLGKIAVELEIDLGAKLPPLP